MQRRLSSFDIYVTKSELQKLIGCHIEKIYQLSRSEILIKIKNIQTKKKEQIYIRNGELICTTEKQIKTPTKPTTFAMALRKYLQNGRITEIIQHEFDRILKIKIGKKEGTYSIIVEFFSDGNIILADPEDKIIIPLIHQSWAHRKVKGREPYTPPPSQINPFGLNKEKFSELLKESNADLVRTLAVNINLSGPIAEEICTRAGVDKKTKIENLNDETITKTFEAFVKFLKIFKEEDFEPVIVKKEENIVDVLPFQFDSYTGFNFEKVDNLSKGLESFIKVKSEKEVKKESKSKKYIGKLNRQLIQQKEAVIKLRKEIDIKKQEGDLIYLSYQEIENLLSEIKTVLELKEKDEEILEINDKEFVKKFNPTENLLVVNLKDTSGKTFEVKLNFRKTVAENAEKAYDDNKKFKRKLNGAEKSIKKTNEQLEIAKKKDSEDRLKEEREQMVQTKKIHWFERYRWFISSQGNLVIGGRDAKTNELLVKKYLKEGDRYAHAEIQGAPSIIIKSKGIGDEKLPISEKTLEEACIFAASYSKAWKQFAEAQAYWVLPEQVSKTARSGEFVPHGAFIIRGKRNYHRCTLELAAGMAEINGENKIMIGPIDAIKTKSKKYVIFRPGDIKKNDFAHRLAKAFDVPVDTADRLLPSGGASVVESMGVDL